MGAMQVVPRQGGGPVADRAAEQVTEAWLANRRLSEHTRAAYRRDVAGWLAWCGERGVDPLRASFLDVNAYARGLEARALAPASVSRKLSGLSSWYDFLVKMRAVEANPVGGADRPYVSRDHSATVGLAPDEVDALLAVARAAGERHRAVITLLADLGLRVGELVGLDVGDVGWERGHRTVRFVGKGGRPRRRALTAGGGRGAGRLSAVAGCRRGAVVRHGVRGADRSACGVPAGPAVGAGGRDPGGGPVVAALVAACVRDGGAGRGGGAGGRAGRDGACRSADHPPVRPGSAQPGS